MTASCGICSKGLSFWNQPLFTKHILTSGESLCTSCFMKINNKSPQVAFNLKKHSLQDIVTVLGFSTKEVEEKQKNVSFSVQTSTTQPQTIPIKKEDSLSHLNTKWYSGENIKGVCYKAERIEPLPNNVTELVRYKSDRFAELFGRGHNCSYFPRYGKIGNRIFTIWYQEFNSKEKKGIVEYKDVGIENDGPHFAEKISNGLAINNQLQRSGEYLSLFNVRETKNNRTWYAGLKSIEFIGIITAGESDN